jgi:hypothetical protein
VEISNPIIWAISVISKKLPEVSNHPMGENSPNLVTLLEKDPLSNCCQFLQTQAAVRKPFGRREKEAN